MGLKKDHEIKCICWWLPLGLHLTLLCWLTASWLLDRFPASLACGSGLGTSTCWLQTLNKKELVFKYNYNLYKYNYNLYNFKWSILQVGCRLWTQKNKFVKVLLQVVWKDLRARVRVSPLVFTSHALFVFYSPVEYLERHSSCENVQDQVVDAVLQITYLLNII